MKTRVVVFGREPLAGLVKTRLAKDLGGDAAARVYEVLLRNTLDAALASGCDVELWLAEAPSAAFQSAQSVPVEVQKGDNIGARMADAFARCHADGVEGVVLIGSDCPHIEATHLRQAVAALEMSPVVLGPSGDGGYWLIAQRAPGADIFSDIPWSHPDTLAITRKRLADLTLDWSEVTTLDDLDTPRDFTKTLEDLRTPSGLVQQLRYAADSSGDG